MSEGTDDTLRRIKDLLEELEVDIENAVDASYSEGYDSGLSDNEGSGYDQGYEDGELAGYETGYEARGAGD